MLANNVSLANCERNVAGRVDLYSGLSVEIYNGKSENHVYVVLYSNIWVTRELHGF